jgi:1-deoxy-D-xylulose-5-phosphate synthase
MPEVGQALEIGKGRIMREGTSVALLTLGGRMREALEAADELASLGWSTTVADARFAKPIDKNMILRLAKNHEVLITIEEGAVGGFAAHVMQFLANSGIFDKGLKFRAMTLPDIFIDHEKPEKQYEIAGLKRSNIVATALLALGETSKIHSDITPAIA